MSLGGDHSSIRQVSFRLNNMLRGGDGGPVSGNTRVGKNQVQGTFKRMLLMLRKEDTHLTVWSTKTKGKVMIGCWCRP